MQVLAVDGGQTAIRLRHSNGTELIEVEGASRLEGNTIATVAVGTGVACLGQAANPGRYDDMVHVWRTTA